MTLRVDAVEDFNNILVVGVCGGSASGKSRLAREISKELVGEVQIIPLDNYYKDSSHLTDHEKTSKNYDHPDAVDLKELYMHLCSLKSGDNVQIPSYCFETHSRLPSYSLMKPSQIIIVEGLFVFETPSLRNIYDLKVFLSTENDLRLARRVIRDVNERGRSLTSVIEQYIYTVKPMHELFVESVKKYADIIIQSEIESDMVQAKEQVINKIKTLLEA